MGMFIDFMGGVFLIAGAAFLLFGGLGLLRMPDVFNRIHSGTKATTLGTLFTLLGAACLHPDWSLKLLLIGVFLIFTNPLSAQVLASAAHLRKMLKTPLTKVDKLAEDEAETGADGEAEGSKDASEEAL